MSTVILTHVNGKNTGELADRRPWLDVQLNNPIQPKWTTGSFLLDTGSTSSFCTTDILRELGVSPTEQFPRDVIGPGGVFQSMAFHARIDPFCTSGEHATSWRVFSVGTGKIFGYFDGILGRDFLKHVSLSLEGGVWTVNVDPQTWANAEFDY